MCHFIIAMTSKVFDEFRNKSYTMKNTKNLILLFSILFLQFSLESGKAKELKIISKFQVNAFPLVQNSSATAILTDAKDAEVVNIAAKCCFQRYRADKRGKSPVITSLKKTRPYLVIVGTIGHSPISTNWSDQRSWMFPKSKASGKLLPSPPSMHP